MQAEILSQWKIGETILNLYQILGVLGEGGFGKVYQVRHTNWNINLAIKIPKPEIVAFAGGNQVCLFQSRSPICGISE